MNLRLAAVVIALALLTALLFVPTEANGGSPPKCECCGESHVEFLAIDHINGGGFKERAKYGNKFAYSIIRRGFPKGYRILCHNCNQARGYYGKCPHEKK